MVGADTLQQRGLFVHQETVLPKNLQAALDGSNLLRLDPDALREQSQLIPRDQPLRFADSRGRGLPALYDALVSRDIDAFLRIRDQARALFPAVKDVGVENISATEN